MVTTRSQSPSPARPAGSDHGSVSSSSNNGNGSRAPTPPPQQPVAAAAGVVAAAAAASLPHQLEQQQEAMVQLQDLECAVCLGLLCEAVTTPCGHTMCRLCLVRALERQKKCPSCRAVCVISAEDHAETLALSRLARKCFPVLYEQRLEETRLEIASRARLLPVFYYNVPMYPGEVLRLHLFEPRYKLMMQRIVNGSRRFAYVPNYTTYRAEAGDVALIAELKEVHFMRDGRAELEARITGRYTIVDSFVEDGTGGLSYCRVEPLGDEEVPPERMPEIRAASEEAHALAFSMFMQRREIKAVIVDRYGEMPSARSPEALSLWIAAVLPTENRHEKHGLLVSRDTLQRLRTCTARLQTLRAGLMSGGHGSGAGSGEESDV